MSRLTRISLLLAMCFTLDKVLALVRQVLIARQFGLSAELDAFNVANNVPDLLYALISGGALSIALIPVLSEVLTLQGRRFAWDLFSRIANLSFLVTGLMSVLVALGAGWLVQWELGIAPGFGAEQRALVVRLMQLNLIATLIFSLSGLVMAGLQSNQHFLLPALAPMLYNIGQIFGAVFLSPEEGLTLGGVTLPSAGLGINGLVYGVILGALLHLGVQIPGLLRFQYHWIPSLGLNRPEVHKVLRLIGPRMVTILFVQIIFLVRDNLASRLAEGSVSALTYGWMIQQMPETLIGTAIGTALLPTLAEHFARKEGEAFQQTVDKALRVLVGLTLPVMAIIMLGLRPFLGLVFGFDEAGTDLLLWVTRGYLLGLTGHCLLEVAARSFYARQNAWIPLAGAVINVVIYILAGSQLYRALGASGISLTDALAFTIQSLFLIFMLNRKMPVRFRIGETLGRAVLAALVGGLITFALTTALGGEGVKGAAVAAAAMLAGTAGALPFVWREARILIRL